MAILLSNAILRNARQKVTDTVIRCENISVAYGAKQALHPVSLSFEAGKIHVMVGQNGAGKTSFARVLAGIVRPKTGRFWIRGQEVRDSNIQLVRRLGLDMVHQRFTLPPNFTAAEALELVSAKKHGGSFFSIKQLRQSWARELQAAGMDISPNVRIRDLPIETVQSLEIVRALSGSADFLILDEPTALLSPAGVERLFARLRQLRDSGVTLLLILHKLREVMDIADTISVLRAGRLVLPPTDMAEVTEQALSDLIIGGTAANHALTNSENASDKGTSGIVHLVLNGVTTQQSETEPALGDVSLAIGSGKILGIAGVEGNGQRSLVDVLTGLMPVQAGTVHLLNQNVTRLKYHQRRAIGLRVVPFDRLAQGASLTLPLWENVTIWNAEKYKRSWLPWLNIKAMRHEAKAALDQFDVQYESLDQPADSLSGGNMQRLILARELLNTPPVVIAAQPTRGLDFRATQFVWQVLRGLKDAGAGILVVSSDLDELFNLSDRILVMRGGQMVGEYLPPFDRQRIGDDMIGALR